VVEPACGIGEKLGSRSFFSLSYVLFLTGVSINYCAEYILELYENTLNDHPQNRADQRQQNDLVQQYPRLMEDSIKTFCFENKYYPNYPQNLKQTAGATLYTHITNRITTAKNIQFYQIIHYPAHGLLHLALLLIMNDGKFVIFLTDHILSFALRLQTNCYTHPSSCTAGVSLD